MARLWSRRWQGFPASLPPLIGRQLEIAAVAALFHEPARRLITLTGPGGVGKTRLAIAVASAIEAELADGAVFVPLAAVSDPTQVLSAVARGLELRESGERPLAETILTALRDRTLLLVLDNFEHLALPGMTAAADVVRLLDGCPNVTVLVTSRSPLHLHGEQRFPTPPLTMPAPGDTTPLETLVDFEAIAFFVERAHWVDPGFALTAENADAITEICRRLDGLPLAIELAAPWVRVLSPQALLARLEQRLPLLRGGAADLPERLRTMHDAIAWSHSLLSRDEAHLFRRLAVFAGGFTLDAAEWVAPDAFAALELLAGLIDKGLLQPMHWKAPEPRFTMLETVREFALERLAESGEAADMQEAHAAYVLDLIERAEPHLLGPDEEQWHRRIDGELANVRVALAWSLERDGKAARRIAAALWPYWGWYQIAEGRKWLGAALAPSAFPSDAVSRKALIVDGALAALEGDGTRCLTSAVDALSLAHAARDGEAEALAGWVLACGHLVGGELHAARDALDEALPRFDRATGPLIPAWAAYARSHRGAIAFLLGDTEGGLAFYEDALARSRQAGSDGMLLVVLSDFAGWLIDLGETARARDLLREALALSTRAGGIWLIGGPLIGLALVDAVTGDAASAARRLGAVEAVRVMGGLATPAQFQVRVDRTAALARAALGEEGYADAWAAGRADPDDVIAAALGRPSARDGSTTDLAAAFGLSPRQREVLALLVAGHSDKEIAAALFVSRPTASKHVAAILAKLGVDSRTAAVSVALQSTSAQFAAPPGANT